MSDLLRDVTHGRHCPCSACGREDWGNPDLAHCGMHGAMCPPVYAPITALSSLDAAWAEVEAALPVVPEQVHPRLRWRIEGLHLVDTSDDEDLSVEQLEWEAEATRGGWPHQPFNVTGYGPTPVAALQALAARLAADAATDEAEHAYPPRDGEAER